MDKYQDFTGSIIKKRAVFFQPNLCYLYLRNDEKQIKVIIGKSAGEQLPIGRKLIVGHIEKKLINIRPFSMVRESYPCNLYGRTIQADECSVVQEIIRKPEEAAELPFDIEEALSLCPQCIYNLHR
ncbi:MAG: hypothetical protein FWE69_01400 [Clostridiales bacterium]|nr:hypothetical protein [Clostridiales bacterium]